MDLRGTDSTAVRRALHHGPTAVRGVLAFTSCSALALIQNQKHNQNIYCSHTILQGNLSYGAQLETEYTID